MAPLPTKTPVKSAPLTSGRFSVVDRATSREGQRITLYGPSGVGKSTLAKLAPGPVLALGLDSGARIHPRTIAGVESYDDVRAVLHDDTLFAPFNTLVIDDLTSLDHLVDAHILKTYRNGKGEKIDQLMQVGFQGEYKLSLSYWRLILADLDRIIAAGKNVVLLAQVAQGSVANAEGVDYSKDLPAISHAKTASSANELVNWSDFVCAIRFSGIVVDPNRGPQGQALNKGKIKQVGDFARIIHTEPAPHFAAKARELPDGYHLPPQISFATPDDASLWTYLFDPTTHTQETK